MKTCSKCGIVKEYSCFRKRPKHVDGHSGTCKQCLNADLRAYLTPEKRRKYKLKATYGISLDEFDFLYSTQKGCCAICGVSINKDFSSKNISKFNVDHDHTTGKVRGLLCTNCNVLLGMSKDSIEVLAKAISYLDRNKDE